MAYFKKISSLKEKTLYQVAINLCQDTSFKKVAIGLEKLTCDGQTSASLWNSRYLEDESRKKTWHSAVNEQCQRLAERLPSSLKHEIYAWIYHIALEYLSYSRRQQLLFGIHGCFLMDFLTESDWLENGRLNEMKIAKRLLRDDRLTIMQRYRIACVYCIHINIPELWSKLTQEEKQSIKWDDDPYYQGNEFLVLLWSGYMDGSPNNRKKWQTKHLWSCAAQISVCYGNQAALMSCWKRLTQHSREKYVVYLALQALQKLKSTERRNKWKRKLLSNKYHSPHKRPVPVKHFNLPSYYGELMRFLLSKMSEKQKLSFFKSAFGNGDYWTTISRDDDYICCVLESFLDWPLQDYFLPTMSLLWGIIPKDKYGQCLLSLACRYRGDFEVLSCYPVLVYGRNVYYSDYDYESMLWNLWEETPDEYKEYVFCHKRNSNDNSRNTVIKTLFLELLKKDPFKEKDIALFKRIWCDIPQLEKRAIMCCKIGELICIELIEKEKFCFVNWLFEESLQNVEILKFKKEFFRSSAFKQICLSKLENNCEEYLKKLIDWCFESDSDKTQFKSDLINYGLDSCSYYLRQGRFAKIEDIINFCLSSDEMKRQFKVNVVKQSCCALFKDCSFEQIHKILIWNSYTEGQIRDFKKELFNMCFVEKNFHVLLNFYSWEQMDKIFTWIFDTEEEIEDFKKNLFNRDGLDTHCNLVFIQKQWENVQRFYEWFCLSSEEILKIKKETVFAPNVMEDVLKTLYMNQTAVYKISMPLKWCLTNEEMVISFRKELLKNLENDKKRYKNIAKAHLGVLVKDLLCHFTKDHDETNRETTFFKNKGEKRPSLTKDDSSSVPSYKHLKIKF